MVIVTAVKPGLAYLLIRDLEARLAGEANPAIRITLEKDLDKYREIAINLGGDPFNMPPIPYEETPKAKYDDALARLAQWEQWRGYCERDEPPPNAKQWNETVRLNEMKRAGERIGFYRRKIASLNERYHFDAIQ